MDACREVDRVIVVLDERRAHDELSAATMRCPGCSGSLRSWGYARSRSLRLSCGARTKLLRPRRARCRDCAVTHVLLPALAPPRHAYAIDVIGEVLLGIAEGDSYRTMAARLELPADTLRGWIRRVRGRAEWLRVQGTAAAAAFDPNLPALEPTASGTPLAEALSALAVAAGAARRMLGPVATTWELIATLAHGQLLAPLRSD